MRGGNAEGFWNGTAERREVYAGALPPDLSRACVIASGFAGDGEALVVAAGAECCCTRNCSSRGTSRYADVIARTQFVSYHSGAAHQPSHTDPGRCRFLSK